jgi:hypothetical protein
MVQIIGEIPSFGSTAGRNLGEGLTKGVERKLGFDQQIKLQEMKKKEDKKLFDDQKFVAGIDTIKKMRSLIEKGNLGRGSGIMSLFGGETARDSGQFEQLGISLIPLAAAGVPVRNQREFEKYSKIITDPTSPDEKLLGALQGLEDIFTNKISSESEGSSSNKSGKKEPFNPSNPSHKAKAAQLYKTFKDKEKVREKLALEFEGL